MIKSVSNRVLGAAAVLYAIYISAVILNAYGAAGVLSLVCFVCAAGLLLYAFLISNRAYRGAYLLFSIGCLVLAGVRAAMSAAGINTVWGTADIFAVGHFLAGVFFLAGCAVFFSAGFRNLNKRLLFINILGAGVICVLFMWVVLFDMNVKSLTAGFCDGIFSAASVILDVVVLAIMIAVFLSAGQKGANRYAGVLLVGVFLYFLNDIVNYYFYFDGGCSLDNVINPVYTGVVLAVSVSAVFMVRKSGSLENILRVPSNIADGKKACLMVLFALLAVVIRPSEPYAALWLLAAAAVYIAARICIGREIKTVELLKNEAMENERLRQLVLQKDERLSLLLNRDTVTGLYNRAHFFNALDEKIKNMESDILALVFIDADRFKTINDTYGHDVGDRVLIELANRIDNWNQNRAVLARFGGDEFVLLFYGDYRKENIEEFASQIINICSEPIFIDQQVMNITISIGVSFCPANARDRITLMKYADIAMYRAKSKGFNKCVFFEPLYNEFVSKKNGIEFLLRRADIEKDFELFYQPQFDIPSGEVIGAEALIRWRNSEHGYIPPVDFIPVAEEIDYIIKIGSWVMMQAVKQVTDWNNLYKIHLKMGINISPKQLNSSDFIEMLKKFVVDKHINSIWLDLELTENIMLEEGERIDQMFVMFRKLGISMSIDDFGTGYSSLGYLKRYQFDRIKIDKALIDNITIRENDREIVKAIISMARTLGIKTIAEGIEKREQLEVLEQLGCEQAQGYLLGRPVTAAVFEDKFINRMIKDKHV